MLAEYGMKGGFSVYKEFDDGCEQMNTCTNTERGCRRTVCVNIALAFLAALLTLTIGLIIGASLEATTITTIMSVLASLAVVFAVLIAVILILRFCMKESGCKCKRCG